MYFTRHVRKRGITDKSTPLQVVELQTRFIINPSLSEGVAEVARILLKHQRDQSTIMQLLRTC
ncbi:hypothetical protein K474DRAFT_1664532, partial [Panus rudis PR-1116 ss-1]